MGRLKNKADTYISSNSFLFSIISFAVILTALTLSGYFISGFYSDRLTDELNRDMLGRCGAVIALTEESKDSSLTSQQIADVYISNPTEFNVQTGEKYLSKYGYGRIMNQRYNKPFYNIFKTIFTLITAIAVIASIVLGAVNLYVNKTILNKISELSDYVKNITGRHCSRLKSNMGGILGYHENCLTLLSERLSGLINSMQEDKLKIKEFMSDISHQIKTPVSVLKMNNEIMISEPEMDADQQLEFLNRNVRQLERIEWLISGLLKMARIDAGIVDYSLNRGSLHKTAELSLYSIKSIAEKKGISLINDIPEDIFFIYDENWMLEAIENLIKNAVEHSNKEQPYIKISAVQTPMTIEMKVTDNGTGIPKNILPDIFKRFYSKNGSADSTNAGIGLSLSKKIFEDFGGSIYAVSSPESGTQITVTFLTKT